MLSPVLPGSRPDQVPWGLDCDQGSEGGLRVDSSCREVACFSCTSSFEEAGEQHGGR